MSIIQVVDGKYEKQAKSIQQSEKERKAAEENWRRYQRAKDAGHQKYMREAKRYTDFYHGEQWDEGDLKKLRDQCRPALTLNMVLSTINTALGEYSARRMDLKFKPRNQGVEETADALTKMWMQIADNTKYDYLEMDVVRDGFIQDRGYFDVRINFTDQLRGEVEMNSLDPLDVLIDPDAKDYDPDTWSEVIHTRWYSPNEIREIYGQKAFDALKFNAGAGLYKGTDSMGFEDKRFGETEQIQVPESMDFDKELKRVRVIERQHYKLTLAPFFVDAQTGDMRQVPEAWEEGRSMAFAEQFGLTVIKRMIRKVRWTVSADSYILHDEWSPYPWFTTVPFFPYFYRGRPFGLVRNLISPQELFNKVSSQELHVVNTTANSGWITEAGSLINITSQELEERGAETGLVLEYAKGSQPPAKIQPNTVPTGLDRIGMKAASAIKEISGISDAMLGMSGGEVSGVAIQAKQMRGQVQLQVPFDNLNRTRRMVADRVMYLIQTFYTEERIIQITDPVSPTGETQPMTVNQQTAEGKVVNDLTLGEYDVVVGIQPARDTFEDSQFAEALEMRNAGIAIPDDVIVDHSHLTRKGDIATRMRQMMGLEQSPEQQEMAQIQQEMMMREAQIQLEKLQAEAEELMSRARLNAARAEHMEGGARSPEVEAKLAEIEAKIAAKREELSARERMHSQGIQMKQDVAELSQQMSLLKTQYQAAMQRDIANINANSRSNSISSTNKPKDK